jgi:hypothetical protein
VKWVRCEVMGREKERRVNPRSSKCKSIPKLTSSIYFRHDGGVCVTRPCSEQGQVLRIRVGSSILGNRSRMAELKYFKR